MRAGFFQFPKHYQLTDFNAAFQPSVIKAFASVTSNSWWKAQREACPSAIRVLVHGEISDNPAITEPELDAEATSRLLDANPDMPRLVITKNEVIHNTHPEPYWTAWVDYHVRWLRRAHALGINGVVGQINSGHPYVYPIDSVNQWAKLAPVDDAMNAGDYWGLHEYWGMAGPWASWPWTCGRHLLCPTKHNILLDEVGFDLYTDGAVEDKHRRGWAANRSAADYVAELVTYHRMITDPRVKGTAIFLLDYDNNEWQSFDTHSIRDMLLQQRDSMDTPDSLMTMPARLVLPVANPRITWTYAQHPTPAKGLDFGCVTGTAVMAMAAGTVDKVQDLGAESYGRWVQINHGWGFTRYAHLGVVKAKKGDEVQAGEVIGWSGNTGKSTGPHLHIEVIPFANHVWPHRVDPAPLLGLGGSVVPEPSQPVPGTAPVEQIRNRIWNAVGVDGMLPYNPTAAFALKARSLKLGAPLTQEWDIDAWRAQGYASGIVYARIGDWGNVQVVDW
jgi:hypothetical protein